MKNDEYDVIIVGSGLYGAVTACCAKEQGLKCLILEQRPFIGGNVRDRDVEGIHVHAYGPHIFHTDKEDVWKFVNRFTKFNNFHYCPLARTNGHLYHLPFNMNTFYQVFGVQTPKEARMCLKKEHEQEYYEHPKNLEEKAISLIGRKLYNLLVKEYTEKQWGRSATELPEFIINRLPLRFTYDNNYFNDKYQGIPIGGYSNWINKMIEGVETHLNVDFLQDKEYWLSRCKKLVYTGSIDSFFDYRFGRLEYRSLRFDETLYETPNYQGCAAINETSRDVPYTRTIEYKHFEFGTQAVTVVTREYPITFINGSIPFYPINNEKNDQIVRLYREYGRTAYLQVSFGGRLGDYKYYNMDDVIHNALNQKLYIV